jgi:hypothetical protein
VFGDSCNYALASLQIDMAPLFKASGLSGYLCRQKLSNCCSLGQITKTLASGDKHTNLQVHEHEHLNGNDEKHSDELRDRIDQSNIT